MASKPINILLASQYVQKLGRTPHRRGFTELPTGATSGSARGTRTWSSSGKETPYQSPYIRTEPTGTVEETYRKSTEIHNRRYHRQSWPTFQVGSPPRDQYTTGASEQRAREVTTEPSPGSRLRPTYVSFRSTIETPRIDPPAALTVPMTPSSSGGTTPTSRLEGPPTIQLRLQDPRRTLYIPERGSFPPPEEDIVIRIALKGKPRGVPCSNCDRLFANCSPCVLDQ
ncbi:hypothetical protein AAG570_005697 [Ranatra chinensis]|uniref:Uncharacterized protein n=1 Tax=Ranatra chinensis TaxID=642074 RepID=A0ABD0XZ57_9HEMI